jgi:ABC-2 type transport system ATP-binding protein
VRDQKPPIIEAIGLVKRYGQVAAVAGVDLVVEDGEIFGILGPNGAGKTTILEMIEGLRAPDEGTIRVAGFDAVTQTDEVRKIIGVQLQSTALFDYLTAAELIELFAGLYDVDGSPQRIDQLLAMVDLQTKRKSRANELSGGQQQRLSIALALVNNPKIAFLDEPTTGLDPAARREMWRTISTVRDAGTTIILTTHYMEEAEVLCDRVAVMDYGRVIACDTPRNLIQQLENLATIRARIETGSLGPDQLAALPGVTSWEEHDQQLSLQTTNVQATLVGLLELAQRHRVDLVDLRTAQANLEDVFLSLTGRTYDGPDGSATESEGATAEPTPRKRRRFGRG